jgi:sensor histidine kinase YesM
MYGYNKISTGYKSIIDFQIEQNNYFLEIDDLNNQLSIGYMFQQISDYSALQGEIERISEKNDDYKTKRPITREQLDFYYLVDTYLEKSNVLLQSLKDGRFGSLNELEKLQDVYSFINISFKNLYSQEIEFIAIAQNQMDSFAKKTLFLNMVLIFLVILLGLIIIRKIKYTSREMNKLTLFAKSVKKNPYSNEKVVIYSDDELSFFANAFNEMISTIQQQMYEIKENSKIREELKNVEIQRLKMSSQLQSSQLKVLQSRINPHFLFNTLNMIKSTAINENFTTTSELIEATAELYKYYLSSQTHSVTIEEELDNLKNYAFIQKSRFGERINFIYQIDSSLLDYVIPSMILQPIVENSIAHGLKKMHSNGQITIKIVRDNNQVIITISDNGEGFSESKIIEVIQKCKDKEISDNIGLRNVYQRLVHFYDNDIELKIESDWDSTSIILCIPYIREIK